MTQKAEQAVVRAILKVVHEPSGDYRVGDWWWSIDRGDESLGGGYYRAGYADDAQSAEAAGLAAAHKLGLRQDGGCAADGIRLVRREEVTT